MARKIVPLTLDGFAAVATPCRTCLFWELDPVRRRAVCEGEEAAEKEAWLSQVLRDWGSCGRVVMVDDEPAGHVIYAPDSLVPGSGAFATAPASTDAVLMTSIWVDPRYRGGGLGRMLVQGMARDLINRGGICAVEVFGDVGIASAIHGQRCAAPATFLERVGFKTHRAHPTAPRYRMDLRGAATWREEVDSALERILGVVRPRSSKAQTPLPQHREAPGQ